MKKITAVVPSRNCRRQLAVCLQALYRSEYIAEIIVADDGSDDGTEEMVRRHWPQITFFSIPVHTGYAHAANAGLRLVRTKYALLIRPDLQPGRSCPGRLLAAMEDEKVFCAVPVFTGTGAQASAGTRGAGLFAQRKKKASCAGTADAGQGRRPAGSGCGQGPEPDAAEILEILAAPDGCALYRMRALEEIGWFDERHFDGLEAFDLSLRGVLYGYRTVEVHGAIVRKQEPLPERGDGNSAEEADTFRRQLAVGNGIYVFYKNLPGLQRLVNLPADVAGRAARTIAFAGRGELDACRMAVVRGHALCSLERERRQALDEGTSIWPENLSDASFLGMEEAACRIYPLFLAEKEPASPDRIPRYLHLQRLLARDRRRIGALLRCRA